MYSKIIKPVVNYITMLKRLIKISEQKDSLKKQTLDKLDMQIEKLRAIDMESNLLKDYCDANCKQNIKPLNY